MGLFGLLLLGAWTAHAAQDAVPPVITVRDKTVECRDPSVNVWVHPVVRDAVDPAPVVTFVSPDGSPQNTDPAAYAVGNHPVSIIATDHANNQSTANVFVNVVDTASPFVEMGQGGTYVMACTGHNGLDGVSLLQWLRAHPSRRAEALQSIAACTLDRQTAVNTQWRHFLTQVINSTATVDTIVGIQDWFENMLYCMYGVLPTRKYREVVTDLCDPAPLITHDRPTSFTVGRTSFDVTGTDFFGNSTTKTVDLNVVDETGPSIEADGWPVHFMVPRWGTGPCSRVRLPRPIADDACSGTTDLHYRWVGARLDNANTPVFAMTADPDVCLPNDAPTTDVRMTVIDPVGNATSSPSDRTTHITVVDRDALPAAQRLTLIPEGSITGNNTQPNLWPNTFTPVPRQGAVSRASGYYSVQALRPTSPGGTAVRNGPLPVTWATSESVVLGTQRQWLTVSDGRSDSVTSVNDGRLFRATFSKEAVYCPLYVNVTETRQSDLVVTRRGLDHSVCFAIDNTAPTFQFDTIPNTWISAADPSATVTVDPQNPNTYPVFFAHTALLPEVKSFDTAGTVHSGITQVIMTIDAQTSNAHPVMNRIYDCGIPLHGAYCDNVGDRTTCEINPGCAWQAGACHARSACESERQLTSGCDTTDPICRADGRLNFAVLDAAVPHSLHVQIFDAAGNHARRTYPFRISNARSGFLMVAQWIDTLLQTPTDAQSELTTAKSLLNTAGSIFVESPGQSFLLASHAREALMTAAGMGVNVEGMTLFLTRAIVSEVRRVIDITRARTVVGNPLYDARYGADWAILGNWTALESANNGSVQLPNIQQTYRNRKFLVSPNNTPLRDYTVAIGPTLQRASVIANAAEHNLDLAEFNPDARDQYEAQAIASAIDAFSALALLFSDDTFTKLYPDLYTPNDVQQRQIQELDGSKYIEAYWRGSPPGRMGGRIARTVAQQISRFISKAEANNYAGIPQSTVATLRDVYGLLAGKAADDPTTTRDDRMGFTQAVALLQGSNALGGGSLPPGFGNRTIIENIYLNAELALEKLRALDAGTLYTVYWQAGLSLTLGMVANFSLYEGATALVPRRITAGRMYLSATGALPVLPLDHPSQTIECRYSRLMYSLAAGRMAPSLERNTVDTFISSKCLMIELYNRYFAGVFFPTIDTPINPAEYNCPAAAGNYNAIAECPVCNLGVAVKDSTCDAVDDNCSGTVDEDYVGTGCGVGACQGTSVCVGGQGLPCVPALAHATIDITCDGIDDDCDGLRDDEWQGNTCGEGGCSSESTCSLVANPVTGTSTWKELACTPLAPPVMYQRNGSGVLVGYHVDGAVTEVSCDGFDNDCDLQVDEGLDKDQDGYGCIPGSGGNCERTGATDRLCSNDTNILTYACPGATFDSNGSVVTACLAWPGSYPWDCSDDHNASFPDAEEICDTIDNNCNRQVDEGVQNICGGCDDALCLVGSTGVDTDQSFDPSGPGATNIVQNPDGSVGLTQQVSTAGDGSVAWITHGGTVSKVDTRTGATLGLYCTALRTGYGPGDPRAESVVTDPCGAGQGASRTAIDPDGNVYISNRAIGLVATISKIADQQNLCNAARWEPPASISATPGTPPSASVPTLATSRDVVGNTDAQQNDIGDGVISDNVDHDTFSVRKCCDASSRITATDYAIPDWIEWAPDGHPQKDALRTLACQHLAANGTRAPFDPFCPGRTTAPAYCSISPPYIAVPACPANQANPKPAYDKVEYWGELDECVLWTRAPHVYWSPAKKAAQRIPGDDYPGLTSNQVGRAVVIDKQGQIWLGMMNLKGFWRIDPSGDLQAHPPSWWNVATNPFGAALDDSGIMWIVGPANGAGGLASMNTTNADVVMGTYNTTSTNQPRFGMKWSPFQAGPVIMMPRYHGDVTSSQSNRRTTSVFRWRRHRSSTNGPVPSVVGSPWFTSGLAYNADPTEGELIDSSVSLADYDTQIQTIRGTDESLNSSSLFTYGIGSYGIGIDGFQRVWLASYSDDRWSVAAFDPTAVRNYDAVAKTGTFARAWIKLPSVANILGQAPDGYFSRGIRVDMIGGTSSDDRRARVWFSRHSLTTPQGAKITAFDVYRDGRFTLMADINLYNPLSLITAIAPVGVDIGAGGKIWTVNSGSNSVSAVDPAVLSQQNIRGDSTALPLSACVSGGGATSGSCLPYATYPVADSPYDYTNFTRTTEGTVTTTQGSFLDTQSGCYGVPVSQWLYLGWRGALPPQTQVYFQARVAAQNSDFDATTRPVCAQDADCRTDSACMNNASNDEIAGNRSGCRCTNSRCELTWYPRTAAASGGGGADPTITCETTAGVSQCYYAPAPNSSPTVSTSPAASLHALPALQNNPQSHSKLIQIRTTLRPAQDGSTLQPRLDAYWVIRNCPAPPPADPNAPPPDPVDPPPPDSGTGGDPPPDDPNDDPIFN